MGDRGRRRDGRSHRGRRYGGIRGFEAGILLRKVSAGSSWIPLSDILTSRNTLGGANESF
jgi:hypothetical protein